MPPVYGCFAAEERGTADDATGDGIWLAADARLEERRRTASALGLDSTTQSDLDLIRAAYLRFGPGCCRHLFGAYAFVVHDRRAGRVFCARDHMGLRPLHYHAGPGHFVVATTAEAVLAYPAVPRELDELALAAHLVDYFPVSLTRSFYAAVRKLPPGCSLLVAPGQQPLVEEHWSPEEVAPIACRSLDEAVMLLREAIKDAVADSLGPGPVGAHLSGGLDSAAIAAIANDELKAEGRALTHGYSWSPSPSVDRTPYPADERPVVLAIAERLGVDVAWRDLRDQDLDADLEREAALETNDTLVFELETLRTAREHGVTTMLSGWGGDEVASFSGVGLTPFHLRHGQWRAAIRDASAPARQRDAGLPRLVHSTAHHLRFAVRQLLTERATRGCDLDGSQETLLREAGDLHPRLRSMAVQSARFSVSGNDPAALRIAYIRNGHLTRRAESWALAGAAHGVSYGFPLLSRRVLETCLGLPVDLWRTGSEPRWLFRRAVEPFVAAEVLDAPNRETARIEAWRRAVVAWGAPSLPAPTPQATYAHLSRRARHRALADDE